MEYEINGIKSNNKKVTFQITKLEKAVAFEKECIIIFYTKKMQSFKKKRKQLNRISKLSWKRNKKKILD